MLKNRDNKVVQKLKSKKLRKIRYELRTLLRLEYPKRDGELHKRLVVLSKDKSISYNERVKKQDFIIRKQEELDLTYKQYPLCCGIYGDRMEHLVYKPVMYQWRFIFCYEGIHEKFPEEYP